MEIGQPIRNSPDNRDRRHFRIKLKNEVHGDWNNHCPIIGLFWFGDSGRTCGWTEIAVCPSARPSIHLRSQKNAWNSPSDYGRVAKRKKRGFVLAPLQTIDLYAQWLVKIGNPARATNKRVVWIDGGNHAREWPAFHTAAFFINEVWYHIFLSAERIGR